MVCIFFVSHAFGFCALEFEVAGFVVVFAAVVSFITLNVVLYRGFYMQFDASYLRFVWLLSVFVLAMLAFVFGANYLALFLG